MRLPTTIWPDEKKRALLARVWADPLGLDPTRHNAEVTRDITGKLAKLAKGFESAGHHPDLSDSLI